MFNDGEFIFDDITCSIVFEFYIKFVPFPHKTFDNMVIDPRVAMLCYVMLCYDMTCHVMSCHVMSCHVMLYWAEMNRLHFGVLGPTKDDSVFRSDHQDGRRNA